MPFDGQNYETKPDVFSLAGLIAWLETQEPEAEYCYTDIGHCLIARYITSHGYRLGPGKVGPGLWFEYDAGGWPISHDLPEHWNDVAQGPPHTFGAALARARKLAGS